MPGFIMGKTTLKKVRSSPEPSTRAASSISVGTVSENCFIRNTPKGQPTVGRMTAQRVLRRCMSASIWLSGMTMTCLGRAMAQMIMVNSMVWP